MSGAAEEPAAVQLRVVTLNVHEFADAEMRCNIARLNEFLSPLAADVICLQEAVARSFRLRSREADLNLDDEAQSDVYEFARRLGFPHSVFASAWHTTFRPRTVFSHAFAQVSRGDVVASSSVVVVCGGKARTRVHCVQCAFESSRRVGAFERNQSRVGRHSGRRG
jgi:endonuclease/exonuclease/phosphatase family metal-dependent hydrolase